MSVQLHTGAPHECGVSGADTGHGSQSVTRDSSGPDSCEYWAGVGIDAEDSSLECFLRELQLLQQHCTSEDGIGTEWAGEVGGDFMWASADTSSAESNDSDAGAPSPHQHLVLLDVNSHISTHRMPFSVDDVVVAALAQGVSAQAA